MYAFIIEGHVSQYNVSLLKTQLYTCMFINAKLIAVHLLKHEKRMITTVMHQL